MKALVHWYLKIGRINRRRFLIAFLGYCLANILIYSVATDVSPLLGMNMLRLIKFIDTALSSDPFLIIGLKKIHYLMIPWQVFVFLVAKFLFLPAVSLRLKDLGKNPRVSLLILLPDVTVIFLFILKQVRPLHLTPFSLSHPGTELLILTGIYIIQFVLYIECLFFPGVPAKEPSLVTQDRNIDESYCIIHKLRSLILNALLFSNAFLICIAFGNIALFFAGGIGLIRAQEIIGEMYLYGRVYHRNYAYALYWLEMAHEQGSFLAQNKIGIIYAGGLGVPKDPDKARDLWLDAADKGFAPSQYNLGEMYRAGAGVAQDFDMAEEWYRKAADQGFGDAQFALSYMHYSNEYLEWQFRDSPETLENLGAKQGIKNGPSKWY